MRLNDKGQCPVCLRKPLVYKRDKHCFCAKCNRSFVLETGEWQANWEWSEPDKRQQHPSFCMCGNCPK